MGPGIVIGLVSLVLLLIGATVMLVGLGDLKRRRRILDAPTCPIAQAPGNGPVEIQGRIVASEQGAIVGPFSGKQGVYVRVVVQEYRSSGKSGHWRTVLDQAQSREFFVDDGSGQLARVVPHAAHFVLDRATLQTSGAFHDASPQLEQFLSSYGLKSTSWLGFNKQMRYQEELLGPGDPLYAIGPSQRRAGPPVQDGYRTAPGSLLVLWGGAGTDELILTNKSEAQLVAHLRTQFIAGAVLAGIGAVGMLIALIAAAAEIASRLL